MALVRRLDRITMDRSSVHKSVECTYSMVSGEGEERFLQIDTYGSADRAIVGKKSQSIRFDAAAVCQLRSIIDQEF